MKTKDLIRIIMIAVKIDIDETMQSMIIDVTGRAEPIGVGKAMPPMPKADDLTVYSNRLKKVALDVKNSAYEQLYMIAMNTPCPEELNDGVSPVPLKMNAVRLAELHKLLASGRGVADYLNNLIVKVSLDERNQHNQMFQVLALMSGAKDNGK